VRHRPTREPLTANDGVLKERVRDADLSPMSSRLSRATIVVERAAIVLLGAFTVHTIVPAGGSVAHFFDYRVYYVLVAAAAFLTIARAIASPLHRGAWIALAAAVSSYAIAEFLWLLLYSGDASVPYPSIADGFYLAFYPLSYVGLLLLLRGRLRSLTPGMWVDGVTAALAAGAVGSAVVVEAVLRTTSGSAPMVATNVAYPLGDVILLSLVIAGFALTGWRPGRAWTLLGISLVVSALADSAYLLATATGTYSEGGILDAAWPAGLLLIAIAARRDDGRDRFSDARGRTLLAVPALCAVTAVAVLVADHFHPLNLLAIGFATLALAGVLARLIVTFRENGALLRQTTDESVTDALTGLANRRRLIADLERAMEVATLDEPWLLAIFDLDGFKGYNDSFGHPAGDALLARLGQKLAEAITGDNRCYRLGGDEFCLLAPGDAMRASELLDASLVALCEKGEGFSVTSSFGVVLIPEQAAEATEALRAADERLYIQKRSKRSTRDEPHEVLLQALYEREPELHSDAHGVAELADAVGRRLGLDDVDAEQLHRAAMLHDIGKIAIPDQILHKPGPLDASEWEFVRRHTLVGERIVCASPALRTVGKIVRSSHERWDGTGYPDQLKGAEIPLAARIVFACSTYSALTASRTYGDILTVDEALLELDRMSGSQFDPEVVRALTAVVHARVQARPQLPVAGS
jgi:two-component system cell cycle response regulator